ncbi:MAG: Bax inhibitor-1/YccA family protein [Candidatus Poseidoniales archaeon]
MVYSNSNPVMNTNFWSNMQDSDRMTFEGTMNKIGYLTGILLLSAIITSAIALSSLENLALVYGLTSMGAIVGFVLVLVIYFTQPENPQTLMTIYAVVEGMFIGGLSSVLEILFPGLILQAVFGTAILCAVMYGLYASKVIRPTPTFNKIVYSLVLTIVLLYLISFILQLFGAQMPFLHDNGPIGIGFSILVLAVGGFMLISDFGFIESSVSYGAPKKFEWYAAFGLLITLIWIYIEMVRLIVKLRSD